MLTALRRHLGFLTALAACGFIAGLLFRYFVDIPQERFAANYLRSGVHGLGVAVAGWAANLSFETTLRDRLRRMPLLAELTMRACVMAVVVTAAALLLQAVIYGEIE